jgi:hypothetical protein
MSFARSLPLLAFLSLLVGIVFCVLAWTVDSAGFRGGYALLAADAEVPDRTLRELLAPLEGDFGGAPVSESSQWALLDEFGSLVRIPLDEYSGRVTAFDPRNDGYAEKVRSFFVRDGKRFVFIPLRSFVRAGGDLENRIAGALGGISFSVEYLGSGRPLGFYALLFAAAALGLLLFRFMRQGRLLADWALPCLPALAAFAFYGAPGFALAALLLGLSGLLREPLAELCGPRRSRSGVLVFFKARGLLSLFFVAACVLAAFYSGFSLPFALGIFVSYAGIYFFSVRTFSLPHAGAHIRFAPVPIIQPALDEGFSAAGKSIPLMLPFALAALLAALLAVRVGGARYEGGTFSFAASQLITEEEYRSHTAFQASFSLRPLGREDAGGPYPTYELGPDGLVNPADEPAAALTASLPADIPPFPLKQLMDFLGADGITDSGTAAAGDGALSGTAAVGLSPFRASW